MSIPSSIALGKDLAVVSKYLGVSSRRRLMTLDGLCTGTDAASSTSSLGVLTHGLLGVGITVTTCLAGNSSIGAGRSIGAGSLALPPQSMVQVKAAGPTPALLGLQRNETSEHRILGTVPSALTFFLISFGILQFDRVPKETCGTFPGGLDFRVFSRKRIRSRTGDPGVAFFSMAALEATPSVNSDVCRSSLEIFFPAIGPTILSRGIPIPDLSISSRSLPLFIYCVLLFVFFLVININYSAHNILFQ